MPWTVLAAGTVAVALFYQMWWGLSVRRQLRDLQRHSKVDPLTGLGTGHFLETERWRAALRSGRPLGVVFMDLAPMRAVRDFFGLGADTDAMIQSMAEAVWRASRHGVDEVFRIVNRPRAFILLLHGPLKDPRRYTWSLLLRMRMRLRGMHASIGVAYTTVTEYEPCRVELLALAERACQRAKQSGGDCALLTLSEPSGSQEALVRKEPLKADPSQEAVPEYIDDKVTEPRARMLSTDRKERACASAAAVVPS